MVCALDGYLLNLDLASLLEECGVIAKQRNSDVRRIRAILGDCQCKGQQKGIGRP